MPDHPDVELYTAVFQTMADVDGQVIARCLEDLREGGRHPLERTAAERETVVDDYLGRPLKGAEGPRFAAVTTGAQQVKVQGALQRLLARDDRAAAQACLASSSAHRA